MPSSDRKGIPQMTRESIENYDDIGDTHGCSRESADHCGGLELSYGAWPFRLVAILAVVLATPEYDDCRDGIIGDFRQLYTSKTKLDERLAKRWAYREFLTIVFPAMLPYLKASMLPYINPDIAFVRVIFIVGTIVPLLVLGALIGILMGHGAFAP